MFLFVDTANKLSVPVYNHQSR